MLCSGFSFNLTVFSFSFSHSSQGNDLRRICKGNDLAAAISVGVATVVLRRVPLATPDSINSAFSHSSKNQPKSHTFCRFRNRKSLQRKRRTFAFEPSLLYQKFFPNLQSHSLFLPSTRRFQGFSAVAAPPPLSSQTEEEDSRENWGLSVLLAQQLSAKMAAAFTSKSLRAARSLLGGLGTNLGVRGTPHEMSCSECLFQQCRTFIQMRTNLKVVDNSGAKRVMCIQALKGKKGARLGDTIVASVKESQPGGKVKKGDVVYGVVVRAAMPRGRCDGSEVKFDDNAVVLVNKQGEPIGTRVFGPVPHELRKKKHVKILSLAEHIA
ncbi:hypothetical protein LOK49_LG09G02323 [Camellia lanceoleosa]|uniref:Uncharacterized protein n=1 Tax=Camellia lanceoleosa TaxID=1840588 RepID=A0ACC0GEA4_9ERIC|nr:hypothetical protein LOK49_LG09G02323 [Camellia lanceoleosa]